MERGWRYAAFRANGDGSYTLVNGELPLSDPSLIRNLSKPHQISGRLNTPLADVRTEDGQPIFQRKRTIIIAEDPNEEIWLGGLVYNFSIDGPQLTLDIAGLTAYPSGEPFDGDVSLVQQDAFDVVRLLWDHLQSKDGGDIGLAIDQRMSGILIGQPAEDVSFETSAGESVDFTAGPVQLNWWTTTDIASKIDSLARDVPFDYLERWSWDGDQPTAFLELGAPTIGVRKTESKFILGVNVFKMPSETLPSDAVVTDVLVLGAGEGRERVRGRASIAPRNSLRSTKVITDKKITANWEADIRAAEELAKYVDDRPGSGITELIIRNSENAEFGSYDVGDEVLYSGDHDWGDVELWVKILSLEVRPETSDDIVARVIRADMVAT